MEAHVLPDIEALVIAWALDSEAVNTVSDRIYGALPSNPTFPAIRITRVGGTPPQRLHWLDEALLQVDVFGGPKATTRLLAATFAAELSTSLVGTHALGVVTAATAGGLQWQPDEAFTPAKPRYTFDATVTYHPLAGS